MKVKLFILLVTMSFFLANNVFAISTPVIEKMDRSADEALQLTKFGQYEGAEHILEQFSNDIVEATSLSQYFTMDEVKILSNSLKKALFAINNANLSPEEKINRVTTFRLVVDALNSRYQPLWTELQDPIMTAFSQVKEAAKENNYDIFRSKLNSFLAKYSLIQPSLKIDLPVDKIQKLDAKITFIDKYSSNLLNDTTGIVQLTKLEADLQNMFDNIDKDETDPSLWWVIITTGSIIILTLSYTGWRKYRGEKKTKQKEHND
ncbi:sporulation protein YpjB [Heyndrickxia vini]|uniref:Sporulation protein YpjB n=1 Tax=Heyndrickxia vini TaxID=1476025 RepID=A0ABX7E6S7_9BACI|nr:sporulation protein YpjB [Heyndrickxia vini]QQZ11040.1 sporulation protein YpjB [Heyndrickxia vini]